MTSSALALAGWAAAAAALVAVALARRKLADHIEAVAEACHELRGPLTAVTLGVELGGRQGALPPARVRAIELELGRAALALNDLEGTSGGISEVLAQRVDAERVDAERVDVGELLRDSVEAWRPSAAARGIELRMRWSGPDGVVRGDRLRLAQATGNLIANAIEHGGETVEVRGRLGPDGARIEVLDGGPGLSAPVAKLIRRPYSRRPRLRPRRRLRRRPRRRPRLRGRGSESRRGSQALRGRGLRIAHEVATAHGGRLAAAPSERGARLVLELPAGQREGSAQAEPR